MTRKCVHGISLETLCDPCMESYGNNRRVEATPDEAAELADRQAKHYAACAAPYYASGRKAALEGKSAAETVGDHWSSTHPALGMLAGWLDEKLSR